MDILAGLNPQQQAAVEALDGPVLIFAGAGSGKTRVLTHRVAHLIETGHARPEEILAVTFTNKAAGEMRERIISLVGPQRGFVSMGTFHSICARILRRDGHYLGYEPGFSIYDDDDGQRLVKQIMQELDISTDMVKPTTIFYGIKQFKTRMVFPDEAAELALSSLDDKIAKVYARYQARLKTANAMDFDDLLLKPLDLFNGHPMVLARYQRRWQYVLVDEYQDTNKAQFLFVEALSREHRNLCAVGDDDQSIYGWRGADISNILDFQESFPNARVFKLEQNYRSTEMILKAASAVVGVNVNRADKELWTAEKGGEPIRLLDAHDDLEEGRLITEEIMRLGREGYRYSDFALLYRTNAQSRSLEDVLRRNAVPYQIIGGTRFYERREIKDILAYFRLVVNPADDVSFQRVVNVPVRGIGKTSQERLAGQAQVQKVNLFAAATIADPATLGTRAAKKIIEFTALIQRLAGRLQTHSLNDWARLLVDELGFIEGFRKEGTDDAQARIENIYELLSAIDEFCQRNPEASLTGYMEEVALLTDVDRYNTESEQVTLMTLHSAKGLEFPVVFLTGMEDGLFPLQRSTEEPQELEEERRLFYVGLTRAMQRAYLTAARVRQRYGDMMISRPSRFLDEIPPEVLEAVERQEPARPAVRSTAGRSSVRAEARRAGRPKTRKATQALKRGGSESDWQAGQSVRHKFFGSGKILQVEGVGPDAKLTVLFQGNQRKKLVAKFANLEII